MKIKLYSLNDEHSKKIEEFLISNNFPYEKKDFNEFKEELRKIAHYLINSKESLLKITRSSCIEIIHGYNQIALTQLLDHIKKYSPKLQ